jgi:transcription elongation factor GreB
MSRMRTPRDVGLIKQDYITIDGHKHLREELDRLLTVERPKVVKGVADAAAEGDRSENAEYIYGKKKLREIDKRIEHITRRLDVLKVVTDIPPEGTEKIFFGAYVEIEDGEGQKHVYRIVGADETDASRNFISIDSPVARALLSKRVGDEVTVRRPKGETTLAILSVRYRASE